MIRRLSLWRRAWASATPYAAAPEAGPTFPYSRPTGTSKRHPAVVFAATAIFSLLLQSAHAQSYDWGAMALISGTMGTNANRLCVGEATRGDIGCPDYAPSVTTAGLEVSGTVSATAFVGDGSGLTGITAAANVSVTTGASGSLVYRDQFGSLFASTGLSISSTTGSVGIGAGAPSAVGSNGLYATGIIQSNWGVIAPNMQVGDGGKYSFGTSANTYMFGNGTAQYIAFTTSGTEAMRIVSTGLIGIGTANPSYTLHLYNNAFWGAGTIRKQALFQTTADERAVVSIRNDWGNAAGDAPFAGIETVARDMTTSGYGAAYFGLKSLKANGGNGDAQISAPNGISFYVNNRNGGVTNGAAGTLAMFINSNSNVIMGTNLPFINNGQLTPNAALQVSGTVYASNIASGGNMNAATTMYVTGGPLMTISGSGPLIRVNGNNLPLTFGANGLGGPEAMRITSSALIGIGTATPTTALEVSGTVSATRFVGDGSGLTGVVTAANDNIISGTAYVKAVQNTGAAISGSLAVAGAVSATGDVKGNTLQLVNAPGDACTTANGGALKRMNGRFYFCRP